MSTILPAPLATSPYAPRLTAALSAVRGAGAALLAVRSAPFLAVEQSSQLKTSVDAAAEGWILGFLETEFRGEPILAEERYEAGQKLVGTTEYWTVDALDGTRSFVDGFDTWCVQVAWVEDASVRVGVVHEPVAARTFVAIRDHGAFLLTATGTRPLRIDERSLDSSPRFIDSTRPVGRVAAIMERRAGRFIECGSIGLKICRVAEGAADVFAKPLRFKLWDVAPGDLVLQEAGGRLHTWVDGPVDYGIASPVYFQDILAAPAGAIGAIARELTG